MANLTEAQLRTLISSITPAVGRRVPILNAVDPDSWNAFIITYENVVKLRGWDDGEVASNRARIRNLVAALEGPAARAVQHINPQQNPDNHNHPYTYEQLKTAYGKVFLPTAASHLAMTQYNVAKQGDAESLLAFHTRMRELFTRAFPGQEAQTSVDLINRFILGLAHPLVRDRTWDAHPTTFSEALEKATSKAAGVIVIHTTQGGAGRRGAVGGLASLGLEPLQADGSLGGTLAGLDGGGTRKKGAGDTCFQCGSPDHYKRDCPELASAGKKGRGGRKGGGRGRGGGRGGGPGGQGGGRRDAGGRFTAKGVNALADLLEGLSMEEEGEDQGN